MATDGSKLPKGLMKALLPVAVILGVVVAGLAFVKSRLTQAPEGGPGPAAIEFHKGSILPDFKLHKFPSGEEIAASSIDAKIVLVNFWATWCEACVTEMPSIVKLRQSFKSQGFEVIAVDMDENPAAVVPKALKTFKIDFPVFMDSDSHLSEAFDVRAIPFTVVLDRNRKILFFEAGGLDWNSPEIQEKLKSWLGQDPVKTKAEG